MDSKLERSQRLKEALNGRTIAWFSEEIGCALSTAHSYVNGSIPPADVAFKIADRLGMDPKWYIFGGAASDSRLEPVAAPAGGIIGVPLYDQEMNVVSNISYTKELLTSVSSDPEALGCLLPSGSAMRPTVPPHAEVIFDKALCRPEDGSVFVLQIRNKLIVRRLSLGIEGEWGTVCDNPAFRNEARVAIDPDCIFGKVVWLSHRP